MKCKNKKGSLLSVAKLSATNHTTKTRFAFALLVYHITNVCVLKRAPLNFANRKEDKTTKKKEFDKNNYIKEFNKQNYKNVAIRINFKEKEVIEHLEKQPSKNAYIISLIKKDMEKTKK